MCESPIRPVFPVIRMQVKELFYYPDPDPLTSPFSWSMRFGERVGDESTFETIDKKGRVVERVSHIVYEHRMAYTKLGRRLIVIPSYRDPVVQPLFPWISFNPVLPSIEDMLKDVGKK